MRGVSLASFIGPVISARNACAPPAPSIGRIATTSTRMPMPPIHCSNVRQTLIDVGSSSSALSTVAPVAVRPDIVSK